MSDIAACRGRFVWHDLVCTDVNAALPFYAGLFPEWKIQEIDMGDGRIYRMINAGGYDFGGLVPLNPGHGIPAHWIPYVAVADCDATVAQIEMLGGKTLAPALSFPGVGRFAVVADPQGGEFKPFQLDDAIALPDRPSIGQVCWHELLTTNIDAARQFYADVFGWQAADIDLGPLGTYTIFKRDGQDVGGGMNMLPGSQAPPHWLNYFYVDSVDGRTKQAENLDAKVDAPPTDIPGIGRFSVLADPIGAVFALFQAPST